MSTSSTSRNEYPHNLIIARWTDRFIAWLIDFIIVYIGLMILFTVISLPFWVYDSAYIGRINNGLGPLHYLVTSTIFFLYWTYFESKTGQSIGKRLLHLRTTNLSGQSIDTKTAVIQSFGKAFLLPLDVVLGWIFTNKRRQRIFNKASDTIVIKLKEKDNTILDDVKYLKD